jgi:hypothetical protein
VLLLENSIPYNQLVENEHIVLFKITIEIVLIGSKTYYGLTTSFGATVLSDTLCYVLYEDTGNGFKNSHDTFDNNSGLGVLSYFNNKIRLVYFTTATNRMIIDVLKKE